MLPALVLPQFFHDRPLASVDSRYTHAGLCCGICRIAFAPRLEDFPFFIGQDVPVHAVSHLDSCVQLERITAQGTTPFTSAASEALRPPSLPLPAYRQ